MRAARISTLTVIIDDIENMVKTCMIHRKCIKHG